MEYLNYMMVIPLFGLKMMLVLRNLVVLYPNGQILQTVVNIPYNAKVVLQLLQLSIMEFYNGAVLMAMMIYWHRRCKYDKLCTVYIVVRQLSWARWHAIYGHPGFNGVNMIWLSFSFVAQEDI
ncbi:MAG: hypothetical protein LC127_04520 [Chitinophagales bacterium]|nr:hypothetical protein [Chitinophagales bacterium]